MKRLLKSGPGQCVFLTSHPSLTIRYTVVENIVISVSLGKSHEATSYILSRNIVLVIISKRTAAIWGYRRSVIIYLTIINVVRMASGWMEGSPTQLVIDL